VIVWLSPEGCILEWNHEAERVFGWRRDEVLGNNYFKRFVPEHVQSEVASEFDGVLAGVPTRNFENVVAHHDGSEHVLLWNVTRVVGDTGELLGAIAAGQDITDRKRAEETLRHQALHDALTDLPNRTSLVGKLAHEIGNTGNDSRVGLLLLGLDRFKEVNDTLGHASGDALLRQVGSRLQNALPGAGTLARVGGDEFAVLLPGADADAACATGERLLRVLEEPFQLDGSALEVSASIGVAVYPAHGDDPAGESVREADTLLRQADIAMYVAKGAQGGLALYTPEHDHHSPERLALVADLRRAIERDELVLHYQPQVDMRSGALAGVEALVRWKHPTRGLVPPDQFITIAEQTRMMKPLTRWVLQAALRQHRAWRDAGLEVPVAINLSVHDLQDPNLADDISALLTSQAVRPEQVCLEITESALLAEPQRARAILACLRDLGVRISIDDFGTGYSSLAYLKDLPVDELKIDRSFVRDMAAEASARAIVGAVVDLAHDLGLRVVAEGVEDRATLEVLASLGCGLVQGYYFCPPLSAAELVDWARGVAPEGLTDGQRSHVDAALAQRVRERTARLAAEEEFLARKRAEAALRVSEERYRSVVDSVKDIIFQTDAEGRWSFLNPAWAEVTGFSVEESLGKRDLDFVHPDDRQRHHDLFRPVIERKEEACRHEVRYLKRDGSVRWFEVLARLTLDPQGAIVGTSGTLSDITERKEVEQRRRALAQAEKLRAMGQMASGVAHDLNQSLGLIAGYGELARLAAEQSPPDLESLREALPIVTQAAMDGGKTVKRLLTFTRRQPDEESEQVDLGQLLREVAELTAPRWRDASQADGRPISLRVQADPAPLVISGWPAGLREALTNLVFNAVDALPRGGTIQLVARRMADHVVLEVVDSGVGMPPEIQARIFEPFFSTKGERGTGLGLAQVFGVVEQHGAQVAVESAPDHGTVFRLTFPAAPPRPLAARGLPASPTGTRARQLRILAVDDEPAMGSMVRRILRRDGHTVVTATSGEQALERLGDGVFDVVISDVGMGPGINGWELAAEVKRRWPALRLILATGWGAAIDPAEARTKGVDAVLAKPYQPADLQRLLAPPLPTLAEPEAA
jgi:diguanylate cyclase (GGDEF)-like protein/PAS domain S-box-containing protein